MPSRNHFLHGDRYTRVARPFWQQFLTEARYLIPFVLIPVGAIAICTAHIEEVELTGRRRIILVSKKLEAVVGNFMKYEVVSGKYGPILPHTSSLTKLVQKVTSRIAESNHLNQKFEVYVVANSQPNAFVAPGGTIVIFQGLFEILQSQDELASVISHELGHFVGRHAAEKLTLSAIFTSMHKLGNTLLPFLFLDNMEKLLKDMTLSLPHFRNLEFEADHIGLVLMANACFDPRTAPVVIKRISGTNSESEWLSTHPPPEDRFNRLAELMPSALAMFNRTDCSVHKAGFLAQWKSIVKRQNS